MLYYNTYHYLDTILDMPKELLESNKVKMERKAKKESEKYRLIKSA